MSRRDGDKTPHSKRDKRDMLNDQANELRELVRVCDVVDPRPTTLGSLIVVAGGKGGVGTTAIATNLAAMLATSDESTVLVDADFQRADATMLCHVQPQRSLADVLAHRAAAQDVIQNHESGLRVLPSDWAPDAPMEMTATLRHRMMGMLAELSARTRYVVVDAGNHRNVLTGQLWQAASQVLAVTTPDDVSVMDTYATIKTLAEPNSATRIATLVNLVDDEVAAEGVQHRLEMSVQRFLAIPIESAGMVFRDSLLEHQQRTGWLGGDMPDCETKSFFHRLAMTYQVLRERAATAAALPEFLREDRSVLEAAA